MHGIYYPFILLVIIVHLCRRKRKFSLFLTEKHDLLLKIICLFIAAYRFGCYCDKFYRDAHRCFKPAFCAENSDFRHTLIYAGKFRFKAKTIKSFTHHRIFRVNSFEVNPRLGGKIKHLLCFFVIFEYHGRSLCI